MKRARAMLLISAAAILPLALCGCGRAPATLAGGKPVHYWVRALEDPDAQVRKKAVDKLGNVGTSDPQAFPAVVAALKDTDPGVRAAAIVALPKFGNKAREALTTLSEVKTGDPDEGVRAKATATLAALEGLPADRP